MRQDWLRYVSLAFGITLSLVMPHFAQGASLNGSRDSMMRQNRVAKQHDFTFLRNSKEIKKFVNMGLLVSVRGNRHYELSGVSFPYARPQSKMFIERLAKQYNNATGEKLVVTSLTRPKNRQPRNSSSLSVHPTGMAIDIRVPRTRSGRRWIESTFLSLEAKGVLEATKERRPPHYHVAIFPEPYEQYVAALKRNGGERQKKTHRVAEGDTLWDLARYYKTSVGRLKQANNLRNTSIYPGQELEIPAE